MKFDELYGRDVYIDNSRVGYIALNKGEGAPIFFGGSKLGVLLENGVIVIKGNEIGYINEEMDVFIHDRCVGKVDDRHNICFNLKALEKAIDNR